MIIVKCCTNMYKPYKQVNCKNKSSNRLLFKYVSFLTTQTKQTLLIIKLTWLVGSLLPVYEPSHFNALFVFNCK